MGTRTGLKLREKASSVQIKTVKDIQTASQTITQDYFLKVYKKVQLLENKISRNDRWLKTLASPISIKFIL